MGSDRGQTPPGGLAVTGVAFLTRGVLTPSIVGPLVFGVLVVVMTIVLFRRRRGHGSRMSVGAGAAGAFYDMLNADKRRAIEIVVEERAAEVDPERATDAVDD